eukprot:317923_1
MSEFTKRVQNKLTYLCQLYSIKQDDLIVQAYKVKTILNENKLLKVLYLLEKHDLNAELLLDDYYKQKPKQSNHNKKRNLNGDDSDIEILKEPPKKQKKTSKE